MVCLTCSQKTCVTVWSIGFHDLPGINGGANYLFAGLLREKQSAEARTAVRQRKRVICSSVHPHTMRPANWVGVGRHHDYLPLIAWHLSKELSNAGADAHLSRCLRATLLRRKRAIVLLRSKQNHCFPIQNSFLQSQFSAEPQINAWPPTFSVV